MKDLDMKRIFIVGCPRSGTTLLQSFLASHPQIESFPESHLFTRLLRKRAPYQNYLNLASSRAKLQFYKFLEDINQPELGSYLPFYFIFISQYVKAFTRVLDEVALSVNKDCWLEKTPDHVLHTDVIEKYIQNAKFIHIVRDGVDVVASLYDVAQQYPDDWHGPWSLDKCIKTWTSCTTASLEKLEHPNHYLVTYDQLVHAPHSTLANISHFIELPIDYTELKAARLVQRGIVLDKESWKSMSDQPLYVNEKRQKFNALFSHEQQAYILKSLEQFTTLNPRYSELGFSSILVNV
ncbi:MAG: sulfotransferase [Cyanobacteria bacterium J06635_10]